MKALKSVLFVAAMAFSSSVWAQDSFEMIQNGRSYQCTAVSGAPGTGSRACAERAHQGPFSQEQSAALCVGASSTAPADCAISAYQGLFTQVQVLELCTGALSIGPSDCAARTSQGLFTGEEAVRLCKKGGTLAIAECAIRAYSGPYSREDAINLCRSTQLPLIEKALNGLLGDDGSNPEHNLKRSLEKALR